MAERTAGEFEELVDECHRFLQEVARAKRLTSYTEVNAVLARRTGQPMFDFRQIEERNQLARVLGGGGAAGGADQVRSGVLRPCAGARRQARNPVPRAHIGQSEGRLLGQADGGSLQGLRAKTSRGLVRSSDCAMDNLARR